MWLRANLHVSILSFPDLTKIPIAKEDKVGFAEESEPRFDST